MNVRGIQGRFSLVVIIGLICALGVLILLVVRERVTVASLEKVARESITSLVSSTITSNTRATATQMADAMANPLYYMDLDTIRAVQSAQKELASTKYVIVYDEHGRIVHDGTEDILSFGMPQTDPLAKQVIASQKLTTLQDGDTLDVSAPIMIGENKIGGVRIGVDLTEVKRQQDIAIAKLHQDMQSRIRRQELAYILAALTAIVTSLSMLLYVNRRIVNPLKRLARATDRFKGGKFEPVMDDGNANEIGMLTRSFNRMGRNLELYDREIRNMAYTDNLTGLANRFAFREFLEEAMRPNELGQHQMIGVLFFDIDHFKRINDTHGHYVGDEVLKIFASRVREVMVRHGASTAMLSRFGGDEFVIGWPSGVWGVDAATEASATREHQRVVTELANGIFDAMEKPVEADGEELVVDTSIGIALYPDGDITAVELIKRADSALYQAKEAGKGCYRYYDFELQQRNERMLQIEMDLEGAWKRGEITVAYQPICRLDTNAIVAVEALLRWVHPEQGHIDPSLFIGMAEATGLIDVLGKEMLHQACMDIAAIKRELPEDYHLALTVNVSALQLRDGILPSLISRAMSESGLSAKSLSIELTESAILQYAEVVEAQLERLHRMGCEVWLDDFGTGYSGLSQLRRVRVNGVKIDRSFITDILTDEEDLRLTSAIIDMARTLDIQCVAEGIEKQGQLDILRERGCEFGQGFFVARPMSAERLREFILERYEELKRLQPPELF